MDFNIGDKVIMKKGHPCGKNSWEILRVGADFKIKCINCGHIVMLSRVKFERAVKSKIEEPL